MLQGLYPSVTRSVSKYYKGIYLNLKGPALPMEKNCLKKGGEIFLKSFFSL